MENCFDYSPHPRCYWQSFLLLVDPDGLTLIDNSNPGSADKILRYIRQAGFALKALNRMLLTQSDYKHAGSLAALKKATRARIYACLFEARAVAPDMFPCSLKTSNMLLKPIIWLAEMIGRISPAHADEHISGGKVLPVLD
jgi:glyoxylase-like metal-dependent hydrolase (beta-lactamase superfamily II)